MPTPTNIPIIPPSPPHGNVHATVNSIVAKLVRNVAFLAAILVVAAGPLMASSANAAPTASSTSHIKATVLASTSPRLTSRPACGFFCSTSIQVSWRYDGNGTGSVTVQGEGFTHGGLVGVTYDYGSGYYRQYTTASQTICNRWYCVVGGQFTVTEPGIGCGDIPGHPGVGVIVDAFDYKSGLDPSQSIATPCQ